MQAPHPGCRIRSVRPKAGGATLVLLPDHATNDRIATLRRVRAVLDEHLRHADIAGIGFLVWGTDFSSSDHARIPSIAMPEFIKNRLLAAKIEEWTGE